MRRALFILSAVLALAVPAYGQQSGVSAPLLNGSGTYYPMTYPDTLASTAPVTAATTTPLISGTANKALYIWFLGAQQTNTNTTETINFKIGTGATCDGSSTTVIPVAEGTGASTAVAAMLHAWSGSTVVDVSSKGTGSINPAPYPLIVTSGATAVNVCMLTAGSTIASAGVALYTTAPYGLSPSNTDQVVMSGSASATFLGAYPDKYVVGSSITTATTTKVVSGVANQRIYAYYLGMQATSNSGATTVFTANWEYGTGTNCGTGTTTILPAAINVTINTHTFAAGNWIAALVGQKYGTQPATSGAGSGVMPTYTPFIVPAGNDVCVVTTGSPIAVTPVSVYAIR